MAVEVAHHEPIAHEERHREVTSGVREAGEGDLRGDHLAYARPVRGATDRARVAHVPVEAARTEDLALLGDRPDEALADRHLGAHAALAVAREGFRRAEADLGMLSCNSYASFIQSVIGGSISSRCVIFNR